MSAWEEIADSGTIERDVPLAPLTTYKLGGPADYLATVETEEELSALAERIAQDPIPVVVIGRGSNVLVSDEGFRGLVVRLGVGFSWVEVGATVVAGGATPLPQLARAAAKAGRGGLEFYVGIPGSVGGAVRMNAGCHGTETRERLIKATIVHLLDGTTTTRTPQELALSYRHSNLGPLDVVTRAEFSSLPVEREASETEMREITRWRREHQPGGVLNAGSVFKNPPGDSAGRLIDEAGLKGLAVGDARVSSEHANFIEAGPLATASDVHALVCEIQQRMRAAGVELEPELRLIGRFP